MLLLAALGGGMIPKMVSISMLCETSQVFLNNRNIMGKEHWTGPIALINNLCFITFYTVTRIFMFPLLIWSWWQFTSASGSGMAYDLGKSTVMHIFAYWFHLICFIPMYLLNVYWYKFILGGLIEAVTGKKNKSIDHLRSEKEVDKKDK